MSASVGTPPVADEEIQYATSWAGSKSRAALPIQLALLVGVLLAWQVTSDVFGFEFYVSKPSDVWTQLVAWQETGLLWLGVRTTMSAALIGFALGAVVGATVGLTLGWSKTLGRILEPFIFALYTLPKIALAPLFVLWFGIGTTPKVVLAAVLVFFLVFFTTFQGAANADRSLLETAVLMGGKKSEIFRKVVVPASGLWIFSGLKIALPYSLIGAVVGEFIAARAGVGFMIKNATSMFNTAGVFAGLVVLMALAWILTRCLNIVERRLLHWNL